MQPQEQIFVPAAAAFSWFGNEVLSLLQLIFFLTLGYAVTRTWIWTRHVGKASIGKKLDDIDQIIEDIHGPSCSESDASPNNESKAGNIQKRKKAKRAKEVVPEKLCTKDNVNNELDSVTHTSAPVPVAPEETAQEAAPEETIQEETPEETAQEETPEETAEEETPEEAAQEETAQEETLEETAQEEAPMSDRVAKMLAKKVERKAKKEAEKLAQEKKEAEDAKLKKMKQAKPTVSARKDVKLTKMDLAKLTASVQKEKALEEERAIELECVAAVETKPAAEDADDAEDNMETDAQSESDDVCVHSSTPEGISTPERCLTPVDPHTWCSAAAQPMMQEMMQEMPCVLSPTSRVPQIEGWMAIAVPAEFAPPGAPGPFDGLWTNAAKEKIVIDHSDILFESGMKWVMEMHSISNFSVDVGGEAFHAELDLASQLIIWSDGDCWTCVGQTDGQQQWAASREAGNMPAMLFEGEASPMLFEGGPFFAPMDNNQFMKVAPMEMAPMEDNKQLIPEDAKSWELCWDWSKKGWCKRGAGCEWYHPPKAEQTWGNQSAQPCMPCESAAPFSGFVEMPFGSDAPFCSQGQIY